MARNKYPEETVNRILDVSLKLFLEKGYDNTSIQDIIDQLGGLSKGAIYHHFESKESILLAVFDRIGDARGNEMDFIMEDRSLNGAEKLKKMFMESWKDTEHRDFVASMPDLLENPRLLAMHIKLTMNHVVPDYILPAIQEGMRDGSIKTGHPQELADVLMLLSNVWMNPLIYPMTKENIESKAAFLSEILTALKLPALNEGMAEHMQSVEQKIELRSKGK